MIQPDLYFFFGPQVHKPGLMVYESGVNTFSIRSLQGTNETSRIILRGLNFEDRRISTEDRGSPRAEGFLSTQEACVPYQPLGHLLASFLRG